MIVREYELAKKYAQAYANLFIHTFSDREIALLREMKIFLQERSHILFIFKLPSRFDKLKDQSIDFLLKNFPIDHGLKKLVKLLEHHRRLALLPLIITALEQLYLEYKGTIKFTIRTSHTLSEQQIKRIKTFLEQQTKKHITYTIKIDKTLIAGLALESDLFGWEYSIAKQLKTIEKVLIHGD